MKNVRQESIVFGLLLLGAGLYQSKADQPVAPQGIITAKVYTNIAGGTLADLKGDAKFTSDTPDVVKWLPYFELWATGTIGTSPPANSGDNYGAKIAGLFWPDVTKNYIFTPTEHHSPSPIRWERAGVRVSAPPNPNLFLRESLVSP